MKEGRTVIVGPGCSGTRFLKRVMPEQYWYPNVSTHAPASYYHDDEGRWTPASFRSGHAGKLPSTADRIILLYADPRNVLISLFSKSKSACMGHQKLLKAAPLIKVEKPLSRSKLEINNEKILEFRALHYFFNTWLETDTAPFKMAFVKYETLHTPEVMTAIADFVGIVEKRSAFYEKLKASHRPRKSDYRKYPPSDQEKLDHMFEDLLETQNNLPPFWIKDQ
tara:strand:- start:19207 stop:19875 length:669 start_codon:yes stop_codon:yes gene_type:complete